MFVSVPSDFYGECLSAVETHNDSSSSREMVYVDDGAVDAAGRKPFMANERADPGRLPLPPGAVQPAEIAESISEGDSVKY